MPDIKEKEKTEPKIKPIKTTAPFSQNDTRKLFDYIKDNNPTSDEKSNLLKIANFVLQDKK